MKRFKNTVNTFLECVDLIAVIVSVFFLFLGIYNNVMLIVIPYILLIAACDVVIRIIVVAIARACIGKYKKRKKYERIYNKYIARKAVREY